MTACENGGSENARQRYDDGGNNATDTGDTGNSEAVGVARIVGYRGEKGECFLATYVIGPEGLLVESDSVSRLEPRGHTFEVVWNDVPDSCGVYLVTCIRDSGSWKLVRRPYPYHTLKMQRTLDQIVRGLTVSPVAVMMTAGDRDGS